MCKDSKTSGEREPARISNDQYEAMELARAVLARASSGQVQLKPTYCEAEKGLSDVLDALVVRPSTRGRVEIRPCVMAFALAMEEKLRKHDATRGPSGWQGDDPRDLMKRLHEEAIELQRVVERESGRDPGYFFADSSELVSEAADVGNFAMMVAEVGGGLVLNEHRLTRLASTGEERSGTAEHVANLEETVRELRALTRGDDPWYWMRDGDNDLDSIVCPVLIEAATLRELLSGEERKPDGPTLYHARCGWCGAYEGTVDPSESCTGGGNVGPHQFGVFEEVGHPQKAEDGDS